MEPEYSKSVFINCPFDEEYLSIFRAITFAVIDCGFIVRCANEMSDSSEVRIDKIVKIISECKYGIHDISRTELDRETNLPRFNMPLKLGMFLGAKRFGKSEQKAKACLVLDRDRYRYHTFMSDIAGQDIKSHENSDSNALKVVTDWLRNVSGRKTIPGGTEILARYRLFNLQLPGVSEELRLTIEEMAFFDYTNIVSIWLRDNPLLYPKSTSRS